MAILFPTVKSAFLVLFPRGGCGHIWNGWIRKGVLSVSAVPDDESALMGGQTVTTIDDLTDAVSGSVVDRVSGMIGDLSARMDALEAGLETVAGSSAGRLQVAGLAERLDDVQATLQAGQELEPVIGDDIGTVIISLVGELLDLTDTDGDGSSDVVSSIADLRGDVQSLSAVVVHPAMTTHFADYTVLEALLLLSLLFAFVKGWIAILGRGFAWMR